MRSGDWLFAGFAGAGFRQVLLSLLGVVILAQPGVALAGAPVAPPTTWVVNNCHDDGAGSLRHAVNEAASGDTIDLTGLSCIINLVDSTLMVTQNNLTLIGPGRSALTLDAGATRGDHMRAITHTGAGTLAITGMTLTHAAPHGTYGGCIDSFANVSLTDVAVVHCIITSFGGSDALGGGVYAGGNVALVDSVVRDNHAVAAGMGAAIGGGIHALGGLKLESSRIGSNAALAFQGIGVGGGAYVQGAVTMIDSQVLGNRATNPFRHDGQSYGGGLVVLYGTFDIAGSTIANNYAGSAGALFSYGSDDGVQLKISNTTISSNHSVTDPGALSVDGALELTNSTVAFNTVDATSTGCVAGIIALHDVTMSSSIVAGNTCHGVPADIKVSTPIVQGAVVGGNDLIFAPVDTIVPADTLIGVGPMLGPLGTHGGTTMTHALLEGSPALDAGSNALGLSWDQRGPGFARVVGGFADIGAFESRPGTLGVAPLAIDFGGVPTGVVDAPVAVTLTNTGDGQIEISDIDVPDAPFFRIGGTCGVDTFMLRANATCTLFYTFAPVDAGSAGQTLTVFSEMGNTELALSGTGVAGDQIFAADFDRG